MLWWCWFSVLASFNMVASSVTSALKDITTTRSVHVRKKKMFSCLKFDFLMLLLTLLYYIAILSYYITTIRSVHVRNKSFSCLKFEFLMLLLTLSTCVKIIFSCLKFVLLTLFLMFQLTSCFCQLIFVVGSVRVCFYLYCFFYFYLVLS